ncbi:MAG: iron-containing alcohol dehydrogenase [Verrucomicrobiota bacterium]|jgi:alcohol dehydrogenase class IV
MRFEFATAGRVIFGPGAAREAGRLARDFGRRALVVTGRDAARAHFLLDSLRENGVLSSPFSVSGEPGIETIEHGVKRAAGENCDLVIGFGGGSALDTGKAIAAMLTNPGDVLDYLEVIGGGKPLREPSAPFLAIPTTAGTGTEVTRNAVLASPVHRVKASLRSPSMLPKIALVDPELTYGLPPAITASTGLDALTQLIEPYVCCRAQAMTDALCVEGMRRATRSLRVAVERGQDAAAREDMALASLFGGMALANAGLGAVHGFAGAIGGMFEAPHGAVCAALLPHVMKANIRALGERDSAGEGLRRYEVVARILTGNAAATAEHGIEWVRQLVGDLRIPPLATYGLTARDASEVIEKAAKASSMKANPIVLTPAELAAILKSAG